MKEFHVGTQLYVGERERKSFSVEEIKKRIYKAKEIAAIDSLMIWTDHDLELYETLIDTCLDCEIEPYLWFPVLADVQGAVISESDLLRNYDDTRGYGRIGIWEKLGTGGENFLFYCPNRKQALENVFEVFKGLIDRLNFTGVMLDRIRYPSAVNGFETLFSCFCDACEKKFLAIYGAPLALQKEAVAWFLSRLGQTSAAEAASWQSFNSLWDSSGVKDLFNFRKQNILQVVEHFSNYARARNLQVGLDLFSLSLSSVVSQDYQLLSRFSHWIKPMVYCHAIGPAGLPLEVACLLEALQILCPKLSPGEVKRAVQNLLSWDWSGGKESLLRRGLPEEVLSTELQKIAAQDIAVGVKVYAGIEAIRNSDFQIDITEEVLRRYLAGACQHADGIIASWNLLHLPEENLKAIGALKL